MLEKKASPVISYILLMTNYFKLITGSSGLSDTFLITSAEGRLQLVGGVRLGSGAPSAKLEKGVEAHRGACLSGRWSHDGAGIVTGGEDGAVKIWSRSGMLRYL